MQIIMPVLNLGLKDEFLEHGDPKVLLKLCGLDKDGVINAIKNRFYK